MVNKKLQDKLDELMTRPNTTYNRGILHGFLLALTTEDRIDGQEAIGLLEKFGERDSVGC